MFSPVRLVCLQDYAKTTDRISAKLGWRIGLGPEDTSLTFGNSPDKGADPGIVITF